MPEIEIEIDEVARKEGLEAIKSAIKKDKNVSVWACVIVSLIKGVDLPAFLKEHGHKRVSPHTTVQEYIEIMKWCGHLVEKEGKTFVNTDELVKGMSPTFRDWVAKISA